MLRLFYGILAFSAITEIHSAGSKKHHKKRAEKVDEEVADLDTRLYLQNLPHFNCYTRLRDLGQCVPLHECPVLRERVRHFDRLYLLQAVSDYICGFEASIRVCCPNAPSFGQPEGTFLGPPQNDEPVPPFAGGGTWGNPPKKPWQRPNEDAWEKPDKPNPNNRPNQPGWLKPVDDRPGWKQPPEWLDDSRPNSPQSPDKGPNQSGWPQNDNRPNRPGWASTEEDRNRPSQGNNGPYQFPDNNQNDTTERTTTTRKPFQEENGSNDGTSHKNSKLLPKNCGADAMSNKVLFGNDTALGEYPWIALIRIRTPGGATFFGCGGSLIHPRYVLTAAHCVNIADVPSAKVDQVRLGEHDTRKEPDCEGTGEFRECSGPSQNIEVEERIVHKGYVATSRGQANDIALLRLKKPAVMSKFVMPICLPLDKVITTRNYDEKSMWVAGWGRTSNDPNSNSPVKQKVSLPVVPDNKCRPIYKNSAYRLDLTETQMCAGGGKADSCRGDSGGPLMSLDQVGATFKWHVQGIVSIGPNKCGTVGMPGIYTRVSGYTNWILDNIRD